MTTYAVALAAQSPQGWWQLNEGDGTAVAASGAIDVDGTTSADWDTAPYTAPSGDRWLYFDGTTSGQIADADAWSFTGDVTISFVFRPGDVAGTHWLVAKLVPHEWYVAQVNAGGLEFQMINTADEGWKWVTTPNGTLSADATYHVVATYNGTTGELALWLNGEEVVTSFMGAAGTRRTSGSAPLMLGQRDTATTTNRYVGHLSQIALWHRVLSDDVIAELYAASIVNDAVTTTKTEDYLGRAVDEPTIDGRDFLGRRISVGDKDFVGRELTN